MTKMIASIAAAIVFFVLATTPGYAQLTRAYVSALGNDANACTHDSPCRTFSGALGKTARGGEITVLNTGSYGAVTINKSVSIVSVGVEAGVLVAGQTAIIVNITDAGDPAIVTIRGLVIEGLGASPTTPGINGISILSAKSVNIHDCIIRGFKSDEGSGINVNPTSVGTKVMISNTLLHANIRGVRALGSGLGTAEIFVDRVVINGVTRGFDVGAGATVRLNNSAVTAANGAIFTANGGQVISFGNNAIAGNNNVARDTPTSVIPLR